MKTKKDFIKKVLSETIIKAELKDENFDCQSFQLFCDLHDVNLSDVAHLVVELRNENVLNQDFGKELRCIDLNP